MIDLLDARVVGLVIASPLVGGVTGAILDRTLRNASLSPQSLDDSWKASCRHGPNRLHGPFYLAFVFFLATMIILTLVPRDRAEISAIFGWFLLSLSFWDIYQGRLPDLLTLPLLIGGVIANACLKASIVHSIAGAAIGFAAFGLTAHAYFRFRGIAGMGGGDIKLFGAAGAWVGWEGLPLVMLLSSTGALAFMIVSGLVKGKSFLSANSFGSASVRFGPFIACATFVSWLWLAWRPHL